MILSAPGVAAKDAGRLGRAGVEKEYDFPPRVVRVSFAAAPIVGDQLEIVVDDLAGNACVMMSCALAAWIRWKRISIRPTAI